MKKAIWLTAIGVSSFTLLTSIGLSQAVSHLWKPEVAQAARVTAHLFKSKSLNPIKLTRQTYVSHSPMQTMPVAVTEAMSVSQILRSSNITVHTIARHPFHPSSSKTQIALQEFKPSLSSSKMTD